jgi:hypothetical protein
MTNRKKQGALIAGVCCFTALAVVGFITIPQLTSAAPFLRGMHGLPGKKISAQDIAVYLKDGDTICRLGDRLWSLYFKDISASDKRFSHLGIVRIVDNTITVINAEGLAIQGKDFVNEVSLEEFLDIARAVGIYRLKNHDGKLISTAALNYVGFPFDWSFDLADTEKIYCTELLYAVLKQIAPEIQLKTIFQKELNKEIIPLEACSNSDYFEEVAYISAE